MYVLLHKEGSYMMNKNEKLSIQSTIPLFGLSVWLKTKINSEKRLRWRRELYRLRRDCDMVEQRDESLSL